MALRRPLVQIAGISAELPIGDVLPNDIAWGILAGRVYQNLFNTATSSAAAQLDSQVYYVPVWIKQAFSTVVLSFAIQARSSDAAATANIGLYDSLSGYPNVLLASQTGMNVSTTGGHTGANATSPIALGKTYPPGLYWLAYSHYAAAAGYPFVYSNSGNTPIKDITGLPDVTQTFVRSGLSSTSPGGSAPAPLPNPIVPANMLDSQLSFILSVMPS